MSTTTLPTMGLPSSAPPRRRLDWRMRLANDLAGSALQDPVHEDFWV
jgi:hypothetical protein